MREALQKTSASVTGMNWSTVSQPDGSSRLGDELLSLLTDGRWVRLDAAVAFVKLSGVRHLAARLDEFSARNPGSVRITVGIDQQGSSIEGVQLLWQVVAPHGGQLFILRNPQGPPSSTFHPKAWLFRDATGDGRAVIGSGNLTQGGLYTNYELAIGMTADAASLSELSAILGVWSDAAQPEVELADAALLGTLYKSGDLPSETAIRRADRAARAVRAGLTGLGGTPATLASIFRGRAVPPAPSAGPLPPLGPPPVTPTAVPRISVPTPASTTPSTSPIAGGVVSLPTYSTLYMLVSPGNKTEIYLTKGARRDDPAFFGWPFTGVTTPKGARNPPQPQADPQPVVEISVMGAAGRLHHEGAHPLKMWVYAVGPSANDDFRITLPAEFLRSVPNNSVMVMEREPTGTALDYRIEFYPPSHPDYLSLVAKCTVPVPNSSRRYGWA